MNPYEIDLAWRVIWLRLRGGDVPSREEIAPLIKCSDIPKRLRGEIAAIVDGSLRPKPGRKPADLGTLMAQTAFACALETMSAKEQERECERWGVPTETLQHTDTLRDWRNPNKAKDPQHAWRFSMRAEYERDPNMFVAFVRSVYPEAKPIIRKKRQRS